MSICACVSAGAFAGFATSFRSALLLYFLAGLCGGGSYTPVLALIAKRFEATKRGTAMGCYLAAASLGYALSLFLCGALVSLVGWRAALAGAASGSVIGMLLGWIATRGIASEAPKRYVIPSWSASAMDLRANKPAQLMIWAYSFHAWELLGMWAWMPAFLVAAAQQDNAFSKNSLAFGVILAGITHLISVLGSAAGGVMADRVGRTTVILIMSIASIGCSFMFGWLWGAPIALVAIVATVYNLTAIADSAVFSTVLTEAVPERYIGFAFSVRSVLGFGMGAISPWVFGVVLDHAGGVGNNAAWGLAWSSLGIGAVLGPVLTLRLHQAKTADCR
jgi:MFS family permease